MGYFNIIDSLNDAKVNEGMTESIPKNKNNDSDKLVKALLSSDIDFIPDKYINSYKSFYIIGQVLVRTLQVMLLNGQVI